ncbi:MAG: ABC transporter ATP-binding protein [Acidimicrobiia bacterium]
MPQPPPTLLAARALTVGHAHRPVVSHVELDVAPGSCTVIVGPNGCGKSTLLRTLAGVTPRLAGTILLDGQELASFSPRARARLVSFLPQAPLTPPGTTVRMLVEHGRHPHRGVLSTLTTSDREAVGWAIDVAAIGPLLDRPVDQLSGGERQRAWIALTLAQRTRVVLLDEPTTFLDVRHQLEMLALLRSLADDHSLALVVVLHDLDHAAAIADQLVVVAGGRVRATGAPREVLTPQCILDAFDVEAEVTEDSSGAVVTRLRLPTPSSVVDLNRWSSGQ